VFVGQVKREEPVRLPFPDNDGCQGGLVPFQHESEMIVIIARHSKARSFSAGHKTREILEQVVVAGTRVVGKKSRCIRLLFENINRLRIARGPFESSHVESWSREQVPDLLRLETSPIEPVKYRHAVKADKEFCRITVEARIA